VPAEMVVVEPDPSITVTSLLPVFAT
jgi:hypothetical protein